MQQTIQYKNVLASIKSEMERFEQQLQDTVLNNENELNNEVLEFLGPSSNSKRIRPVLMFLILKAMDIEIKDEHYKVAVATELLHSATLVHDDIIDCALIRREKDCWHQKYDSKLAVIMGDYLLSLSLKTLSELNSCEIFKIFSQNVLKICGGEISQYVKRYEVPSIEGYIEKSKNKTGLLFLCAVKSALSISNAENAQMAEDFAIDFGTAFQIGNDLKSDKDIENGIYTLAAIYFKQDNPSCDIITLDTESFNKANIFLNNFIDKTKQKADFTNVEASKVLQELCELLRVKGK